MDFRLAPRFALVALATTLATFTAAASAHAATGEGADFAPSVRATHLHLQVVERGAVSTIHWQGERYRALRRYDLDPVDDVFFVDIVGSTMRDATGVPGAARNVQVGRNVSVVAPDGWRWLDGDVMGYAWPLVARVRSGGRLLVTTSGGRRVLRGVVRLAANECAGLQRGVRTVDLDPATLVPRRVTDRRGGVVERDMRFLPRVPSASDFAPLRVIGRQTVRDDRFMRRADAASVAARVSWPISMPASLPAGFRLSHVGDAPLGARLGPEGYMPQSRGVFFATWRNGLESIDFTIRPARSTLTRDWDDSDPFGGECTAAATTEVMVGSSTAKYATGEFGSPRMWWRSGSTLYTLSGPFSAEQLATIARSLTLVEG